MKASAASGNVCPGDNSAEFLVVGVVVASDDVPADHAGLFLVAGVVGAVEGTENGRSCSPGRAMAIFLISRRCGKVNFGGRPPLYFGYSELNPSALKLRITSRTRSPLVNATLAIAATSMP